MREQERDSGTDNALARVTVDLGALRANYRRIAETGSRAAAVVKANGYGLGAVRVADAVRKEGCRDFFVATVAEGIALRRADGDANVFVFSGPTSRGSAAAMVRHGLTPVLNDATQLECWRKHRETPAAVHIDTGMHRLGFDCEALVPETFDGLNVCLVLSHLACADEPDHPLNQRQVARFEGVRSLFPNAVGSLANSAAALSGVNSDVTRAGIALYGGNPFSAQPNPMLPVATLQAQVVALRDVAAGDSIGYGAAFVADRAAHIAVLGIGYADGIPRGLSAETRVAFGNQRLPVVGRVSMDLLHVDASTVQGEIALGDWVEIYGRVVGVDETAAWAGTISYELFTRLGERVHRRYTNGVPAGDGSQGS